MDHDLLVAHMQHHWAAATGGLAFFRRVAGSPIPEAEGLLDDLVREIAEDRETLRALMHAVGATPTRVGALAARGGEVLGRLKPNGHLLRRSPLTDVIETEALRVAVSGKRAGWDVLSDAAQDEARLDADLVQRLIERADSQLERLAALHATVAHNRLRDVAHSP
jgi:hypothetical protein